MESWAVSIPAVRGGALQGMRGGRRLGRCAPEDLLGLLMSMENLPGIRGKQR